MQICVFPSGPSATFPCGKCSSVRVRLLRYGDLTKIIHFASEMRLRWLLPARAWLKDAHSAKQINMLRRPRGAGTPFVVAHLRPARRFAVQGWHRWLRPCANVIAPGNVRGWVFAPAHPYRFAGLSSASADVLPVGRLPIITFSLGNYWGSLLPNRPLGFASPGLLGEPGPPNAARAAPSCARRAFPAAPPSPPRPRRHLPPPRDALPPPAAERTPPVPVRPKERPWGPPT